MAAYLGDWAFVIMLLVLLLFSDDETCILAAKVTCKPTEGYREGSDGRCYRLGTSAENVRVTSEQSFQMYRVN